MSPRSRLSGTLFLSLLGIADAWYLAQHALTDTALNCVVGSGALSGCNVVAQSPYSNFFGIPLGVYGIAFYSLIFIFALLAQYTRVPGVHRILAVLGVFGMLASLYFVGIQFFVINALCIYCLISFALATGIFFLTLTFWRHTHPPLPGAAEATS
jgi:uncharacterized membrane protein